MKRAGEDPLPLKEPGLSLSGRRSVHVPVAGSRHELLALLRLQHKLLYPYDLGASRVAARNSGIFSPVWHESWHALNRPTPPNGASFCLHSAQSPQPSQFVKRPTRREAVAESEPAAQFQVVSLVALVHMKLSSFRLKDRVHLLDSIGVGLVDQTWPVRLQPELAPCLQQLLDHPDG